MMNLFSFDPQGAALGAAVGLVMIGVYYGGRWILAKVQATSRDQLAESATRIRPAGRDEPDAHALLPSRQLPGKRRPPGIPGKGDWFAMFRGGILESSKVQAVACTLIALSFLDFFMTYALLREHPMFYESNPVAHWFFERWNVAGLLAFKFTIVGGVIALSEVIERRRRGWGRLVLWIGCVATAYAVYKGGILYLG